jgi:hypothetical protein
MTQRIFALLMTSGVAIATVTSALALAGLDDSAAASQATPAPPAPPGITKVEYKAVLTPPPAPAQEKEQPVRVLKAAPAPKAAVVQKRVAPVAAFAPAPAAPAAGVVFAAPVALNNDGQVRQYAQQFRPILRAEYHIVRVVCRLTPEQRKEIARAGEQSLRVAASKYVDMMRRPMTAAQRAALDPRRQIRESLADAVKARLSAELAGRLQDEIAKRDASRKQLAVRNLVARLDHDLVLSPDQRDKVAESLSSHWDDSWGQSLEMFMYNYQFLPQIPDQYVAPLLNDSQKKVWRSTQKIQTFWGGFGMMGGVMVDDPLEDDELREARLEAAKNDPDPAPNQPAMMMRGAVMKVQAAPAPARPDEAPLKVIRKKAQPAEKSQATAKTTRTQTTKELPK